MSLQKGIDHFTVACLVAWPLNESEALIEKSPCLSHLDDVILMLISRNLPKKSSEVSINTRSPLASFSFKYQATKTTTVKWSIGRPLMLDNDPLTTRV